MVADYVLRLRWRFAAKQNFRKTAYLPHKMTIMKAVTYRKFRTTIMAFPSIENITFE